MARDKLKREKRETARKATEARRRRFIFRWDTRKRAERQGRVKPLEETLDGKALLTEREAIVFLRLDELHDGNAGRALDALNRLVDDKRLLRPVVYSGKGGGRRIYPRAELEEFIERQRGLRTK